MILTGEELEEFNSKNPSELGDMIYVRVSVGVGNPSREEVMKELNKVQARIATGLLGTRQVYTEDFD